MRKKSWIFNNQRNAFIPLMAQYVIELQQLSFVRDMNRLSKHTDILPF